MLEGLPGSARNWRPAWWTLIGHIARTLETRGRCVGLHLAYGVTAATPDAGNPQAILHLCLESHDPHPAGEKIASPMLAWMFVLNIRDAVMFPDKIAKPASRMAEPSPPRVKYQIH